MAEDSRPDTWDHIHKVQTLLTHVITNFIWRAHVHDQSKLVEPEKSAYDRITSNLKDVEYGSQKYKDALAANKPAIQHHYEHNRHHPEYHVNGIADMNGMDIIEMLCDWRASSLRHDPPNTIEKSIRINKERFGYGDEMEQLLINTARDLGFTGDSA